MGRPTIAHEFLTLGNSLARPETCPELKAAWDRILEHAEKIEIEGLNELWDFYLERLTEYEMGGCPMKLHSEKRNLLYRATEWIGKKLSPPEK